MPRLQILSRALGALVLLLGCAYLIPAPAAAAGSAFPETIPLPDGFAPEGIVSGHGTEFYAGSLADGSIYRGDLRTGAGEILVPGTGTPAVGLAFDARTGYLFVAGGEAGTVHVYDARRGSPVGSYELGSGDTFVNDVVVTRTAAYLTDSFQAVLYRVPLSPSGAIPDPADVEALPLSGDFTMAPGFNANGIDSTPTGDALIIVQSNLGLLHRVDPDTGEATQIDLDGASVSAGDGILLEGRTLYVLRNSFNELAVVELDHDLAAGQVVGTVTDPAFQVPTTLLRFGNHIYAVNARFDVPVTPDTEYSIVRIERPRG